MTQKDPDLRYLFEFQVLFNQRFNSVACSVHIFFCLRGIFSLLPHCVYGLRSFFLQTVLYLKLQKKKKKAQRCFLQLATLCHGNVERILHGEMSKNERLTIESFNVCSSILATRVESSKDAFFLFSPENVQLRPCTCLCQWGCSHSNSMSFCVPCWCFLCFFQCMLI